MAGTTARYETSINNPSTSLKLLTCRNSGLKAISLVGQAQWMEVTLSNLVMLSFKCGVHGRFRVFPVLGL
jgi:hypothetical protein